MFLNTLQKEPQGPTSSTVKHHLCGITSMLVGVDLPCIFFLKKGKSCCALTFYFHLLLQRCWIWKASSKRYVAALVDRSDLECSCWCCSGESISWSSVCWRYKGQWRSMMIHVGRSFSPYLASWVLQIICFLSIGCCNWSYFRGDSSQWKHGYSNWLCPMCRTLPWKGNFAVPCSCFNLFVF